MQVQRSRFKVQGCFRLRQGYGVTRAHTQATGRSTDALSDRSDLSDTSLRLRIAATDDKSPRESENRTSDGNGDFFRPSGGFGAAA